MKKYKKILILGSGALKIGEAGEFDYSGSQAIKALKEENIKTVLINPNIATVQTSNDLADEVYFLPVNEEFVEKVIEKEKPDGILLSFGGQTALNCGIALHEKGILTKHHVDILGTPISAIVLTEDRQKFAEHLAKINIPTPASHAATTLKKAEEIAEKIGYPVMIRAGFALGGQGSGIVKNVQELRKIAGRALQFAPQILVEQYLHHFKEIEYEVVRDKADNCITVCNMENMDPLGIHTGESVVVAPSQTLSNEEYHGLREVSLKIVRSLGIVGECNVQLALDPKTFTYYVIEVNARLSRSSALASKATGYPLAYVAAKLALGYTLPKLPNKVTEVTSAFFEPALDYVVVKIPRWDLGKFKNADMKIGTSMKSVGEVMGIGRTFEEAYQKAIRMLDLGYTGATSEKIFTTKNHVIENLKTPTPKRIFALARAIKHNISIKQIHIMTGIDPWFLERIKNIVEKESQLKKTKELKNEFLLELKQLGFSDERIGEIIGKTEMEIRKIRKSFNILPSIFQIDTLAAEFPAKTNYLYTTYNGFHHDVSPTKNSVIVLGSGPYRIGSSVEFDWCSVNTVLQLKKYKKEPIVINCNPETVSTDYDIAGRLYFEELTFERIADIYEFENPLGIIVSVGGQTPNNQVKKLYKEHIKILGTDPTDIDRAEDRNKFSALLDTLKIQQPAWRSFTTLSKAKQFAKKVGYPVLIRPSYVLSGSAMNICYSDYDLEEYIKEASIISKEYPVTVSKFFDKAKEVEFDAVAQSGQIKASVISEHIENAGVHSGDASVILPAVHINKETQKNISEVGVKLARALNITGPFNIQFLARDNKVYVIELNARASRTFPFVSKVTGTNLIALFVKALFEENIPEQKMPSPRFFAVKVPQFSFSRLLGADPILRVEMGSTGEVACFGDTLEEAFLKGLLAVGGKIPQKGVFLSLGGDEKKQRFLESARLLATLKIPLFVTEKTGKFLRHHGIPCTTVYKIHEEKSPNILQHFQQGKIDLAINIVDRYIKKDIDDDYAMRRAAVDNNIPLFTKIKKSRMVVASIITSTFHSPEIKSWKEYIQ